ncbi:MAG: hypothetical protein P1V51_09835 [Deltaproteobacteria bacterium]|nr:hypothetical protein [Deltaproteobacteria bacterium]
MARAAPCLLLIFLCLGAGERQQLLPASEAPARDWFGYRADASAAGRVVGAPLTEVRGQKEAGAVYLYRRDGARPIQRIPAPQPKLGGRFGAAVALGDDALLVGAPGKACAYLYAPDPDGRWQVVATLRPPTGGAFIGHSWFGNAVAIFGDTLAVGAPSQEGGGLDPAGSVHLFRRGEDGQWRHAGALHHPRGEPGDGFGMSLAGTGDLLVVGAPRDHVDRWWFRGTAHLFRRDAEGRFHHERELEPVGPPWRWSHFGGAVDVDERGRVAIAGGSSRWALDGAAVIYQPGPGGAWEGVALFPRLPGDLPPPSRHPTSHTTEVRLAGGRLFLAAAQPGFGLERPGVLVFQESDAGWVPGESLELPPQNAAAQYWYLSLAAHGEEVVVGVLHHDTSVGARARGSAHLFELR